MAGFRSVAHSCPTGQSEFIVHGGVVGVGVGVGVGGGGVGGIGIITVA